MPSERIVPAVLRAFDAGTYLARVTLAGSIAGSLRDIPVARDIAAAEMSAGRKVAVLLFDDSSKADGVVLAVWT